MQALMRETYNPMDFKKSNDAIIQLQREKVQNLIFSLVKSKVESFKGKRMATIYEGLPNGIQCKRKYLSYLKNMNKILGQNLKGSETIKKRNTPPSNLLSISPEENIKEPSIRVIQIDLPKEVKNDN